jgi:hydroxyacylglutathione hydrolase
MFFRQVLYSDLGCASYVFGDAGEAIVVDPRFDAEIYLEIAAENKATITHVLETHEHADHVSGRPVLRAATDAATHRPLVPGEVSAPDHLAAGDTISVGSLRLTALGTPGHRPEHLAFALADLTRGEDPWMVLTGDSLLVGDVARPDLAYEPTEGATALHATLGQLLALGDHVEVWPGHVGGSLCGGAGLSNKTSSTIGYERRHNPLLSAATAAFVAGVTESLPTRPPNIERIVAINRRADGPVPATPGLLAADGLRAAIAVGAAVLDSRSPDQFDAGHLPGAVNLPITSAGAGTRAGWGLDPERPLVIVAADASAGTTTARALQAVGFWNLTGIAVADLESWQAAGIETSVAPAAWDVARLAAEVADGAVELVDVREDSEWDLGHVAGSHHLPLKALRDVSSLPVGESHGPIAVACAAGVRAAFAASLLRRAGFTDVVRVAGGGIPDLDARGIALEVGDAAEV